MIYINLFVISFLAATILPLSSEITLAGLMVVQSYNNLILLLAASVGTFLGYLLIGVLEFILENLSPKNGFRLIKIK